MMKLQDAIHAITQAFESTPDPDAVLVSYRAVQTLRHWAGPQPVRAIGVIEGGCLQYVAADAPINFSLIDWDDQPEDEADRNALAAEFGALPESAF